MSVLGIRTPELVLLHLGKSPEGGRELHFLPDRRPVASGLHLGSKCPVNPDLIAIFDFLPRSLYAKVTNLNNVGAAYAFDQWVVHHERRQFIFAREASSTSSVRPAKATPFVSWAIDNGMCFGKDWVLIAPSPTAGAFSDIYSCFDLEASAVAGAQLIRSMPTSELHAAARDIPRDWLGAGDENRLQAMLEVLQTRQQSIVDSVYEHLVGLQVAMRLAS
jgi:hypothetical protein